MGRKKNRHPLLEKVEITGVAAEGKALARVGNKVIFVPFAAPGDVVDIQVRKSRRSYMEGVVHHFHTFSSQRVDPFCTHFGLCGGCKWQHLPYDEQLKFKQQHVIDSLSRIGHADLTKAEVLPISGASQTTHYRNKLEYTFSNRRWLTREDIDSGRPVPQMAALGFHIPGLFDKVLDVETCWLQAEPSNEIRLAVKQHALDQGLSFFDLRANAGLLRNLIVRNTPQGQWMVVVVFGENDSLGIESVMTFLDSRFPLLTCLAYMINSKGNSSIADLDPIIWQGKHGNDHIEENLEGLRFQVGPKSFFQTNSAQALTLYQVVREFAMLSGKELVYDLYTGTGSIACFLAGNSGKVVGIEYIEEAVEHARENARINGIENAEFFAGDMAEVLSPDFIETHGSPQVIVTDPPRAGMHPRVIEQLIASEAGRIVYVSCNPATQARDVALLSSHYAVRKVKPVDMFPHTHHVESVVLLERIL